MKRIFLMFLVVVVVLGVMPIVNLEVDAEAISVSYNADAALEFAKSHCAKDEENYPTNTDDKKENEKNKKLCTDDWQCAAFVSQCLLAGGFPKKLSSQAGMGGFAGQITDYGEKITSTKTGEGYVKMSSFSRTLVKGSPIIILYGYEEGSGQGHIVLYSGETDSDGTLLVYAHNSRKRNEKLWVEPETIEIFAVELPAAESSIETGKCGENVTYTFDKSIGTLTISGTGNMYDYIVENGNIPWNKYRCDIKTVIINEGVTSICAFAFAYCEELTSVTISDSVTNIGEWAFDCCTSLESMDIPDSVANIGSFAFHETALYNDSSNWEDDVLYISNHLIEAKDTISGVYKIKDGTKVIADQGFQDCINLTSVIIPESITNIGRWAFHNCASLEKITIPDGVIIIGDFAFWDCTSLVSVTIPNSITSIAYYMFGGCTNLTSITIPNSVTSIQTYAFYNCESLKDVYYKGSETEWTRIHIVDYNGGNDILKNATIHYNYTEKEPTFIEKVISFFQQIVSFFVNLFKF